ncbi:MAG TPA: hypothetical protein VMC09_10795 [Anaerolineales bacterium]|nr:hypothetical protein [Anaerolineales bacterium]
MKLIRFLLPIVLLFLVAGCSYTVTRTGKGVFQVTTSLTSPQIQTAIQNSLADPSINSLAASLQDGYILVSGKHVRADGTGTDSLSFRLDLGVADGHLAATVSNVQVDNWLAGPDLVNSWNQKLADGLTRVGQKTAHSTLQSVSVTPAAVTLVWQVTR